MRQNVQFLFWFCESPRWLGTCRCLHVSKWILHMVSAVTFLCVLVLTYLCMYSFKTMKKCLQSAVVHMEATTNAFSFMKNPGEKANVPCDKVSHAQYHGYPHLKISKHEDSALLYEVPALQKSTLSFLLRKFQSSYPGLLACYSICHRKSLLLTQQTSHQDADT